MWFTLFSFSTLLFCSSHLTSHTSEATLNNTMADHELQQEIFVEHSRKPIKFIDLNEDVIYHIVEQLDLMELVILVETIPQIYPLAVGVFRKRYDELKMRDIFSSNRSYRREYHTEGTCIETYFLESTLSLLKHFGSVIKKLSYHMIHREKNYTTIDLYVNKYCSQSLIQLNLNYKRSFENFTKPFEQVKDLTFGIDEEVTMGAFTSDQLFPKLQRLTLDICGNFDFNFINHKYPHLEHMYLLIKYDSWQHRDQIEQFLRNNTHIRSLEIYFIPEYNHVFTLNEINGMLPNLENLTTHTFPIGNDAVCFENVKHFTVSSCYPKSMEKLSFHQLESFTVKHVATNNFDSFIRFLEKHRNLKRLNLEISGAVVNDVDAILDQLENLLEIRIEFKWHFDEEFISHVIQTHQKLNKFEFTTNLPMAGDFTDLRNRFEGEWDIVDGCANLKNCLGLSFVRKN